MKRCSLIQRLFWFNSLYLFLHNLNRWLVICEAKVFAIGTGCASGDVRPLCQRQRAKRLLVVAFPPIDWPESWQIVVVQTVIERNVWRIIDVHTLVGWTYQLVDFGSPGLLLKRALLANRLLKRALQTRDGVTLLGRINAHRRAPVLLNIERQRVHNTWSRVVTHLVVNYVFLDVDGWITIEEPDCILLIRLCVLYGLLKVVSYVHVIIVILLLLFIMLYYIF